MAPHADFAIFGQQAARAMGADEPDEPVIT
jgi:hypothetical protein